MTTAPRRAFLSFCKLCGWSHTGEEACKAKVSSTPSEPPTNPENAAPTEPPPAECRHETIWRDRRGTGWTCWDCGFRQEPVKASHFIRALADEMVPPIKSGTYAELERHDHKRMRAELEAIIRWLDKEDR